MAPRAAASCRPRAIPAVRPERPLQPAPARRQARPRCPWSRLAGVAGVVAVAALSALSPALPAWADTVYRWTDEQGRVHYGTQVPERYRGQARAIDTAVPAPTEEERQRAIERAQRDKSRAAALGASAPASASEAARPAEPAASRPPAKRPAQVPDDRTDCATWQRLYEESQACFAPYRTVRGGTRPEAFERCNDVPEPPPTRCRMRMPLLEPGAPR